MSLSTPFIRRPVATTLLTGAIGYKSLDSILRRHLDQQPLNPPATRSLPSHDNIRGAAYFE